MKGNPIQRRIQVLGEGGEARMVGVAAGAVPLPPQLGVWGSAVISRS